MNSLTVGTLDQIVAQFQSQATAWGGAFSTVATALFWALFAIEFVISGIGVALQRDLFGDWVAWLVRQILAAGWPRSSSHSGHWGSPAMWRSASSASRLVPASSR